LLSKQMNIAEKVWKEAIEEMVKPNLKEVNLKAFELGLSEN